MIAKAFSKQLAYLPVSFTIKLANIVKYNVEVVEIKVVSLVLFETKAFVFVSLTLLKEKSAG